MVADFDYRYLIPVIPFACIAAGLSFAPRRTAVGPVTPPASPTRTSTEAETGSETQTGTETGSETVESTVPDSVS
jgi:hypothetical protein